MTAQNIFQDNHDERPTTKIFKTEDEEEHFSIGSLVEGSITRVGNVNSAENFHALVRQNARFEEVSHQLINHVEQFLDISETPLF